MPDIEALSRKLKSSDAEERREAVVDLGRAGRAAVPFLVQALTDPDWRVRKTVVEALVSCADDGVVTALILVLSTHDNAGARNSAIEALVQIGREAVGQLLPAASTPDPDVRKFIVDILGDIRDPRAVPVLISMLEDRDENIQVAAAEALGKIRDPRAVDALIACLIRSDLGWLDYAAAEALGEIGDERALAPLLAALARNDLREPVLAALGRIGNEDTLGPLLESLEDPLRVVREASIIALVAIYRKASAAGRESIIKTVRGRVSDRAAGYLEDVLAVGEGELQKAAITLLGWTGRESSIRKMLAALREETLEDTMTQSLGHLGADTARILLPYLTSENALVRRTAARVLGEIGVREAEAPLIGLLTDRNGHVRSSSAAALGRMQSRKAVKPLLAMLSDEYENVQEAAIHALAVIGDESMLEGLIRDFSSQEAFLRRNIAVLLGKFRTDEALDALAFALKDEEPAVRKAVVGALGNAHGGRALRPLLLAAADDDPEVRMLAAEALGKTGDTEAFDALAQLLEDQDLWVRASAARGLGRFGGARAAEVLSVHLADAADIFLLALLEVLGKFDAPHIGGQLLAYIGHADPEVRKTAMAALAGSEGEAVLHAAVERLSDPHWSVRKAAIEVLKRRNYAAAAPLLKALAESDPDPAVQQAAQEALGN